MGFCSLDWWGLLMYTIMTSPLVFPFDFTNVSTHDRVKHTHTYTHARTMFTSDCKNVRARMEIVTCCREEATCN